MFPFTQITGPCRTVFSDPSLRPAKVHYFAIHSLHANDSTLFIHCFAIVTWPLQHPLLNTYGKPYQVWCSSVYDTSSDNCIIPLENISSVLQVGQCTCPLQYWASIRFTTFKSAAFAALMSYIALQVLKFRSYIIPTITPINLNFKVTGGLLCYQYKSLHLTYQLLGNSTPEVFY